MFFVVSSSEILAGVQAFQHISPRSLRHVVVEEAYAARARRVTPACVYEVGGGLHRRGKLQGQRELLAAGRGEEREEESLARHRAARAPDSGHSTSSKLRFDWEIEKKGDLALGD